MPIVNEKSQEFRTLKAQFKKSRIMSEEEAVRATVKQMLEEAARNATDVVDLGAVVAEMIRVLL